MINLNAVIIKGTGKSVLRVFTVHAYLIRLEKSPEDIILRCIPNNEV